MPGAAGRKTVVYNHNAQFIAHPLARTGVVEGNPIHEDMLYAARAAKLAFILNVALDSDKKIIRAVAEDCEQAHKEGRDFLSARCGASAVPADIVHAWEGAARPGWLLRRAIPCRAVLFYFDLSIRLRGTERVAVHIC